MTATPIVVVANNKGGVGKSTVAINLAAAMSLSHKRTLLLDFDPQGNTNSFLTKNSRATVLKDLPDSWWPKPTFPALMRGKEFGKPLETVRETRIPVKSESKIFTSPYLEEGMVMLRDEMQASQDRSRFLPFVQAVAEDFDLVILDTGPETAAILTDAALIAGTHLLLPYVPEQWSIDGMIKTVGRMNALRKSLGTGIQILGFLPTKVQYAVHDANMSAILKKYPEYALPPVKQRSSVTQMVSAQLDIFSLSPPVDAQAGLVSSDEATADFAEVYKAVAGRLFK
jgi:chromosome partitioning protein